MSGSIPSNKPEAPESFTGNPGGDLDGPRSSTSITQLMEQLSFPAVLHYLQSEWRQFDRSRNEWEIEKADLKVCLDNMQNPIERI